MRIITRYILRQHIGPFIFGFSIITLIWILNLLFKELNRILSKGLPPLVVVEFFALNLAWMFALTVPMAVLIASLMAFGRMSADNEVTAMKANGISLYRAVAPVMAAAALVSLFLIWFNNEVLPEFNHRLATLMRDIAQKKPTLNIEAGVWYEELNNYGLMVSEISDSGGVAKVKNVLIQDYSDKEITSTITARWGTIHTNRNTGMLEISLYDGEIQQMNVNKQEEFQRLSFPSHLIRIDVLDQFLRRSETTYRSDREKSSEMLLQEVRDMRRDISNRQHAISALAGVNLQKTFGSSFGLPLPSPTDTTILQNLNVENQRLVENVLDEPAISESIRTPVPSRGRRTSVAPTPTQSPEARWRALTSRVRSSEQAVLRDLRTNSAQIKATDRRVDKNMVEVHKKYSIPVACVIFVLIGAPLGIKARTGSLGVGSAISLFFFMLYWVSLISGEDLADRGIISPFMAMWLANFIVGAAGIYVTYITVMEKELVTPMRVVRFVQRHWKRLLLFGFVEDWLARRRLNVKRVG